MTILHIDSSAQQQGSISRKLSARIVDQLGSETIRRDLSDALPPVTEVWVNSNSHLPNNEHQSSKKH